LARNGVNFAYKVVISLTCRKILRHGTDGFFFPSEGSHATDLYPLLKKIHRSRPGLNLRTLGPMASTITTRPSRETHFD
jgi:hypothetical protein